MSLSTESPANELQRPASGAEPRQRWRRDLQWALLSPLFLGTIPILAKVAYSAGVDTLTVVAFRTLAAAVLMWVATLLFARNMIRSSVPAVVSSLMAGAINGLGSLFYYGSLARIDASLGQLINITYLIFVTVLLRLTGSRSSRLALFRILLSLLAIYLLTRSSVGRPEWAGISMMLVAALFYGVQLVLGQRILYDIPAVTMALYAVTAMAVVVSFGWVLFPADLAAVSTSGWRAILLMGTATALSRMALFLGVKHIGSMQTALLGILEVLVTIFIAGIYLGERLSGIQWLGAAVLLASVLLVRFEKKEPRVFDWWQILWRRFIKKPL